jgi:hypothetical protein
VGLIRRVPFVLFSFVIIVSCTSTPEVLPAAAVETPTPTPVVTSEPEQATSDFFLDVTGPQNESVVATSTTTVRGRTVADAALTINGEVVPVGPTGEFTKSLLVQEGPNFIEVIASNIRGDEASVMLSIIYLP